MCIGRINVDLDGIDLRLREQQALQRSLKDREKDLAALRLRNRLEVSFLSFLGGDSRLN